MYLGGEGMDKETMRIIDRYTKEDILALVVKGMVGEGQLPHKIICRIDEMIHQLSSRVQPLTIIAKDIGQDEILREVGIFVTLGKEFESYSKGIINGVYEQYLIQQVGQVILSITLTETVKAIKLKEEKLGRRLKVQKAPGKNWPIQKQSKLYEMVMKGTDEKGQKELKEIKINEAHIVVPAMTLSSLLIFQKVGSENGKKNEGCPYRAENCKKDQCPVCQM